MGNVPFSNGLSDEQKTVVLNRINEKIKRAGVFSTAKKLEFWCVLKDELRQRKTELYEQFLSLGNANVPVEKEYAFFRSIQQKILQIISIEEMFEKSDKTLTDLIEEKKKYENMVKSKSNGDTAPKSSERGG